MADLISLTFLHLQQCWVINPPKPTAIHVKHRTKSEHHIFFKFFIQSYQTPSPASLLQICYRQNVQQTQLHKKQNKKIIIAMKAESLTGQICKTFQWWLWSKNYFVAFSYLQKSFFRVYCIPSASDRSRVSPLVFCSPAALITHDKRSLTLRRDRSESNDKHQCVLQSS